MKPRILLTGATGYVGGRLLHVFEEHDIPVRCLARRPQVLADRVKQGTEVVQGDLTELHSLEGAFEGIETAYYLVHSMGASGSFRRQDMEAAENFLKAAESAGIRKIIYLGGLGSGENLSEHLESRQEVGRRLRSSSIPTIEFRAGIILGSGSLSFEIIRALVQRLPIMTTPKWVRTLTQPIAVEDVVQYLFLASEKSIEESRIFEIGGPDQLSYGDLLKVHAKQRGLRRIILPVPVLSPGLSSLWLDLITPVYARIGRHLIEGLKNETVVHSNEALQEFSVKPMSMPEAIRRALSNEDREFAQTRWSDAFSSVGQEPEEAHRHYKNRIVDSRATKANASTEEAFRRIQEIGGKNGWYAANLLWEIRGILDRIFGGVGLRRGRRDPRNLSVGDALDFWRVEDYVPDKLLRLRAEMKVPGRAWLQFEVEEVEDGSVIRQTAMFDPLGLFGLVYWYALYPLHGPIFRGMLRTIKKKAEANGPQVGSVKAS